jgi:NADH-quinone oxidoreductase subunit C
MSESQPEMLVRKVNERFPGALLESVEFRGDHSILVDGQKLVEVARFLKEDPELDFTYLLYNTAVDWPARQPRFDVIWEVRSLARGTRVRLKAQAAMPECRVPSLTSIWPAANWHERETYDLLGIRFDGHPDLRRILMPDTWEGHPLRKDYVSFGEPVIFSDEKLEGLEPDAIRG